MRFYVIKMPKIFRGIINFFKSLFKKREKKDTLKE